MNELKLLQLKREYTLKKLLMNQPSEEQRSHLQDLRNKISDQSKEKY